MPQLKEINSWYYLHVGDFSCFLYGSINVSGKPPLLHHIHPSTYCTFSFSCCNSPNALPPVSLDLQFFPSNALTTHNILHSIASLLTVNHTQFLNYLHFLIGHSTIKPKSLTLQKARAKSPEEHREYQTQWNLIGNGLPNNNNT